MSRLIDFTHKGWFGLCPIYMADVETESPRIHPRVPFTDWLIHLSAHIYGLLGAQEWPIMFTGECVPPKKIKVDC